MSDFDSELKYVSPAAGGKKTKKFGELQASAQAPFPKKKYLFPVLKAGSLFILGILLFLLLISYHTGDWSWDTASGRPVSNLLGKPGAVTADLLFQTIGWAAFFVPLSCWLIALRLLKKPNLPYRRLRLFTGLIALAAFAFFLGLAFPEQSASLTAPATGGVLGLLATGPIRSLSAMTGLWSVALLAVFALILSLVCGFFSTGFSVREWQAFLRRVIFILKTALQSSAVRKTRERLYRLFLKAALFLTAFIRQSPLPPATESEEGLSFSPFSAAEEESPPPLLKLRQEVSTGDEKQGIPFPEKPAAPPEKKKRLNLIKAAETLKKTVSQPISPQASSQAPAVLPGGWETPSLALLNSPPPGKNTALSAEARQKNAAKLEAVLNDYGIRGKIVDIRPGPVVTLYELEPAPGIRSSRIIGLADDIARSLSVTAVRIATVSGRNVIGIEIPNSIRETVFLRELLESPVLHQQDPGSLTVALGKNIGGEPVFVDLAKMPHLLIAGTTGSGKSVGVNAMIMSLLFRLSPEQCRLIMIDPKMLELSVYADIPHLLTPVVTDPSKAVTALKWTVREMERRYRAMSQLGVRNIGGYNQRVEEARVKGEIVTRRVQTGIDHETGKALFEEQPLALSPLPFIVVIIDEVADLMMVAGKEIETTVQRLAQMARAAGIHVIMATQRPSVDVITGTIKANFPTRISFQVISKFDSRTILGEQGAEQLLGQGDMLYMAGGGRINRIHGPFVSDQEVERVAASLCQQGMPDYIEEVTVQPDEEQSDSVMPGAADSERDLYRQAVEMVLRENKASTSFLQRTLQIGYNRAARLIEQMEKEGIVGPANHVGKREIFRHQNPD